jgi:hypothetical protein
MENKFKNDEFYHILALFKYDMKNVANALGYEEWKFFHLLRQESCLSGYEKYEEHIEFIFSDSMRYVAGKGLDDAMNNREVNPPARTGEYLFEYLYSYFRYSSELPF